MIKKYTLFFFVTICSSQLFAQENAPYSRYGLGEVVATQNISSRGMAGISAGFIDSVGFIPYSQSINLNNPASLGSLNTTVYDLGIEVASRTLKSNITGEKYTATNAVFSYLQLGFPVTPKKMMAKGNYWNMAVGLRPVTRINYLIADDSRITGIDSVRNLFEGNGGINQANFSTGIKIKNFSIGVSTGYTFGNRNISQKTILLNDSILYAQANNKEDARFGGFFLNVGAQYFYKLPSKNVLRFGVVANLQQNLKAKRSKVNESFVFDGNGEAVGIDTATALTNVAGTVTLPATYSAGFTYNSPHWIVGADIDYAMWKNYNYFNEKDAVQNTTKFRIGAQYYPANVNTQIRKKLSFIKYRAGLFYGNDYVQLNNSNRPNYGITFGAGIPLTDFNRLRLGDFVTLNTGVEIAQQGSKQNQSLREGIVRFNIGFAMTAAWFQKRKYE